MRNFVITSEAVSIGHPDKLCDQISDAIIDGCLSAGMRSGVNAECALATGVVFLSIHAGEDLAIDPTDIARQVIADAGYDAGALGKSPTVMLDIARPEALPMQGARQRVASRMVTAFGYACDATQEAMPLPIWLAHRFCRAVDAARRDDRLDWISPDMQAQAAVRFENRRPVAVDAIAFLFGTRRAVSEEFARAALMHEIVRPVMASAPLNLHPDTRLVTVGAVGEAGPLAHSGLTGRKSGDDAYGSFIRRAGPSLSGKDPSRVDRIANYAARHAARNVLAAGLAREVEVQLSYVIGDEAPVSVEVDTYGSGAVPDAAISTRLRDKLDFRVAAIAERMDLWALPGLRDGSFYRDLAVYGQMGRDDLAAPWEDVALAAVLA
jgi:S-adenosylmethionine synthetase